MVDTADRQARAGGAGHETADAAAAPMARIALALGLFLGLTFFGVLILFKVFNYYQPRLDGPTHPLAQSREVSAAPRLQIDPPTQKLELRAVEDHVLTTYDWVDRENGLVRIPIVRAMDLLATRGLPEKSGPVEVGGSR